MQPVGAPAASDSEADGKTRDIRMRREADECEKADVKSQMKRVHHRRVLVRVRAALHVEHGCGAGVDDAPGYSPLHQKAAERWGTLQVLGGLSPGGG